MGWIAAGACHGLDEPCLAEADTVPNEKQARQQHQQPREAEGWCAEPMPGVAVTLGDAVAST